MDNANSSDDLNSTARKIVIENLQTEIKNLVMNTDGMMYKRNMLSFELFCIDKEIYAAGEKLHQLEKRIESTKKRS